LCRVCKPIPKLSIGIVNIEKLWFDPTHPALNRYVVRNHLLLQGLERGLDRATKD